MARAKIVYVIGAIVSIIFGFSRCESKSVGTEATTAETSTEGFSEADSVSMGADTMYAPSPSDLETPDNGSEESYQAEMDPDELRDRVLIINSSGVQGLEINYSFDNVNWDDLTLSKNSRTPIPVGSSSRVYLKVITKGSKVSTLTVVGGEDIVINWNYTSKKYTLSRI